MCWLNKLDSINWDAVSALAAWIEILIIFLPALLGFIFYKLRYADCWVYEQTPNGMKIAVHNKSKSSLFVVDEKIIIKNKRETLHLPISRPANRKTEYICIKPDQLFFIYIDYNIYNISLSDQITLEIQFGGKRRKKKKRIKRG